MEWMLLPLKRYADFSGRSRRKEYWMFFLLNFIIGMVLYALMMITAVGAATTVDEYGNVSAGASAGIGIFGIILVIYWLAILLPSIAVQVRRFHDQDKSGWMVLLNLVPFGGLVVLIFMFMEGTRGPNQYGPDPKGAEGVIA